MADALFLAISVLTIGSAIAALEMRSLVYGSIALMGTLGGVAGFYVMLDSPFVAMFQLAVYVGSIAVLILFTVMLVKRELIFKKIEDPKRKFAGIGLMLIVILALGAIIMDSGIKSISTDSDPVDFREIGGDFMTYYWPALVLMALILAGSVMGALVLARREALSRRGKTADTSKDRTRVEAAKKSDSELVSTSPATKYFSISELPMITFLYEVVLLPIIPTPSLALLKSIISLSLLKKHNVSLTL